MKIFHFNSTHGNNYVFRREPEKLQWHIWFGAHVWTIQFNCKCNACKVKRYKDFCKRWFGEELSDEALVEASKRWGKTSTMKQALTQLHFRESLKKQ